MHGVTVLKEEQMLQGPLIGPLVKNQFGMHS